MQIPVSKDEFKPEALREEEIGCVWIWLESRHSPRPIQSRAIQHVDWWLQGAVSRFIKEDMSKNQTTFIATRGRMKAPWVAIDCGKEFETDRFFKNASGMQLEKIVALCESSEDAVTLRKSLAKEKNQAYPEQLSIVGDESLPPPLG